MKSLLEYSDYLDFTDYYSLLSVSRRFHCVGRRIFYKRNKRQIIQQMLDNETLEIGDIGAFVRPAEFEWMLKIGLKSELDKEFGTGCTAEMQQYMEVLDAFLLNLCDKMCFWSNIQLKKFE